MVVFVIELVPKLAVLVIILEIESFGPAGIMDTQKTKNAIHYVIHKAQCLGLILGSVRLNKILFCSDVEAFDANLEYITNGKYIRRPQGPALYDFPYMILDLKNAGIITETIVETEQYDLREYKSLVEPNDSFFTEAEMAILDGHIQEICGQPAQNAVDRTHNQIWNISEENDFLPVAGYFSTTVVPLTTEDANALYDECVAADRRFRSIIS